MSKTNNGGPAFPEGESWITTDVVGNQTYNSRNPLRPGMTLRDYFAAKALQGDLACQSDSTGYLDCRCKDETILTHARLYYRIADAMLKAREAKQEGSK